MDSDIWIIDMGPSPPSEEQYDADLSRVNGHAARAVAWLLLCLLMLLMGVWPLIVWAAPHAVVEVIRLARCREPVMPMFYRWRSSSA